MKMVVDIGLIIQIIALILGIPSILFIVKEWNLIRNSFNKIKTLFRVYILWSKEDRIKAIEIRKKYQSPKGVWTKDESKIISKKPIRRIRYQ